jgi:uncharacterized RDD family membrane protein YckC
VAADRPVTAFGGALDDPTKVMGARIGAFLVDSVLVTVLALLVFVALSSGDYDTFDTSQPSAPTCAELNGATVAFDDQRLDSPSRSSDVTCFQIGSTAYLLSAQQVTDARTTINVLFAALTFANAVLLQSASGATVGKRLFGLRVAVASGQIAGIGRNALRWLLMIVDAACCFLPGLISANSTKGHRRIGDLAAGTFVVHRSALGRVLHIPGLVVVRQRHEFGTTGPAPVRQPPTVGEGGGIDGPAWDPARGTYVRYDQGQGIWFQWDEGRQEWIPVPT